MKKALVALLITAIISIGLVFLLIPQNLRVVNEKKIAVNRNGFNACLHDLKKWKQWWPADSQRNFQQQLPDSVFSFDNVQYKLSKPLSDGAEIQLKYDNLETLLRIMIIPGIYDTLTVRWFVSLDAGFNPISRLKTNLIAKKIYKNVDSVFTRLGLFAGNDENVYGFPIVRTTFLDTILVVTNLTTSENPTTNDIYKVINKLKKYISEQNVSEKDYPMLNTKSIDNGQYETMIALCVDKKVPDTKDYSVVRMVNMKDRFLRTEVTGGPFSIKDAHDAIVKYMEDRKLSTPGRPFEVLVTDRSKETDTSKWKTIIFHPSM